MNRIDFLKKSFGFLGMAVVGPSLLGGSEAEACTVASTETAGPFPTINPASYVRNNIVGTRTGVPFTINISVKNVLSNCAAVAGLLVDIWHCDKDGNYSQYGGSTMQPTNYTTQDFLRGRQTTDANGLVSFTSIFPGWYQSRATHIHVHIYTASGTSLLISQIAFPESATSAVATVNAATAYGYTKGMSGYTYNASDNVFSDGTATEMGTITGSLTAGYVLSWDAFVSSTALATKSAAAETQFQIRQNFPNPASDLTRIPVVLRTPSEVQVTVVSMTGQQVLRQVLGTLSAGEKMIDLDVSALAAGSYVTTVKVANLSGTFTQSQLLLKN
ncbi:dioxygenase family protein [Hymenobacter convexus]|uniref:dioxygenase family protein n=1 Tax=Hymenobacter sp. CA1UV-4 TaxID=3063782 RepID=UPI0035108F12